MRVYVYMYKLFCPNMTGIVDSPKKSCDLDKTPGLVTCFGELLIDFVPNVSGVSLAEAPAFKKAPGGAPVVVVVEIYGRISEMLCELRSSVAYKFFGAVSEGVWR